MVTFMLCKAKHLTIFTIFIAKVQTFIYLMYKTVTFIIVDKYGLFISGLSDIIWCSVIDNNLNSLSLMTLQNSPLK